MVTGSVTVFGGGGGETTARAGPVCGGSNCEAQVEKAARVHPQPLPAQLQTHGIFDMKWSIFPLQVCP